MTDLELAREEAQFMRISLHRTGVLAREFIRLDAENQELKAELARIRANEYHQRYLDDRREGFARSDNEDDGWF